MIGIKPNGDRTYVDLGPFMESGTTKDIGGMVVRNLAALEQWVSAGFFSEGWTVKGPWKEGDPMPSQHPRRFEVLWGFVEDHDGCDHFFFEMRRVRGKIVLELMNVDPDKYDMVDNKWSVLAPVKSN